MTIDYSADIGAAVTDEDTYSRFLLGHVFFRGVLLIFNLSASDVSQKLHRPGRGAAGLDYTFRDIFGTLERPGKENALFGRCRRSKLSRLCEVEVIQVNRAHVGEFFRILRRAQSRGQDDHVEFFFAPLFAVVGGLQGQTFRLEVLSYDRRPRIDVLDAVAVFCPFVIFIEALAEGPHVHHEDLAFGIGQVLFGDYRLLGRIHATHRRAVRVVRVTRADTLDKGDFLGLGSVGKSLYVPLERPRSTENSLIVHAADNVGETPVPVLGLFLGIVQLESRRQDDRTNIQSQLLRRIVVEHSIRLTDLLAQSTPRTHGTVQTPLSLGPGNLLSESEIDLVEGTPSFEADGRHFVPGACLLFPFFQLLGGNLDDRLIILLRLELLAPDVCVDRPGGELAVSRRLNHAGSAANHIAPDEDSLPGSHARLLVDLDCTAFCQLDLSALAEKTKIGFLTDSNDQFVRSEDILAARDSFEFQSALDKCHLLDVQQFQARELTVFDDDSLGRLGGPNCHTLFFGPVDLPRICRHLVASFEADDGNIFTAEPQRRTGAVHGDVAPADYDHVLLDGFHLAEPDVAQKRDAAQCIFAILAIDSHPQAFVGADR